MRRMGLDPAHTVSVDTLVTLWERMGGICPCGCERPMALDAANRHDRPSVEQVFPGQGYMPGNVSILRLGCNVELRDLAPERLRQLADFREALQRAALRVRDAA